MKNKLCKILSFTALITLCIVAALFSACSENVAPSYLLNPAISVTEYESAEIPVKGGIAATFLSEDPAVATVDGSGRVYGVKKGRTNITVTAGGITEKCQVTVLRNGTCPYLSLDKETLKIAQGGKLSVNAELIYKGEKVNAELNVSISSDKITAVKTDGKFVFTGVSVTEEPVLAEIYCEYYGRTFTKTVTAEVVGNSGLYVAENGVTVYSFDDGGNLNDKGFYRNYALDYGIDGDSGSETVVWRSLDESIASVTDGVITGNKQGVTQVYASVTINGTEYRSYCQVTVLYPEIRTEKTFRIYKDPADGDTDLTIDGYSFFGKPIADIAVYVNGEQFGAEITGNNSLSFDREKITAGEKEIVIDVKDCARYVLKTDVYTKIVNTAEELLNLKDYGEYKDLGVWETDGDGGEKKYAGTKYTLDGFFALGGNIDLAGCGVITDYSGYSTHVTVTENGKPVKNQPTEYGFIGTFDGQGYTIKNGSFGYGGLFGQVGKSGIVRNVAFTNATLVATAADTYADVIANLFCGKAENLLVEVNTVRNEIAWGHTSCICRSAIGASFVNCVVYYPQNGAFNGMYSFCLYAFSSNALYMGAPSVTAENCYSISGGYTGQYSYGGLGLVNDHSVSKAFVDNVRSYDYGTTCLQIEWTGLNSGEDGFWDFSG